MRTFPRILRLLAAGWLSLGLGPTNPARAVTLHFFPATAWSPEVAQLNQNLGLTNGYVFEEFEGGPFAPGLSLILANFGFDEYYAPECSPYPPNDHFHREFLTQELPEQVRMFQPWTGAGTIASAVAAGDPGAPDPRYGVGRSHTLFRFSPGASSVGIGLSGMAFPTFIPPPPPAAPNLCDFGGYVPSTGPGNHQCVVTVNGTNWVFSLEGLAGTDWTSGLVRNGYLRIDAAPDETISAVGFHSPPLNVPCLDPQTGNGRLDAELLGFDHLAWRPSKRVFVWKGSSNEPENWAQPCNWTLDGLRGAGVPGTNDLDVVLIPAIGRYPTNTFGQVSELRLQGFGAALGGEVRTELSILDRLEFNDLRDPEHDRWGRVTLHLRETGRLFCLRQSALGYRQPDGVIIEFHGSTQLPRPFPPHEASDWLLSGLINNHSRFEWNSHAPLGNCFGGGCGFAFNNHQELVKVDDSGRWELAGLVTNHPTGRIEIRGGTLQLFGGVLENQGDIVALQPDARLDFARSQLIMAPGGRFRGPGALQSDSLLEMRADCPIENLILRAAVVHGPGQLTLPGRATVLAPSWILGVRHPLNPDSVLDATPVFEISPGAEMTVHSDLLLGRQLENHGRLQIEAAFGLARDQAGRPAAVITQPDGRIEGRPPGWGYTGWADGVVTNLGLAQFRPHRGDAGVAYFNRGRIEVLEGEFQPKGYQQASGELRVVSNAYATVFGPADITGGVLSGRGAIRLSAPGTISATIRPGTPLGILQLAGLNSISTITYAPDTVVEIEIGGRIVGEEYDQLQGEGGERAPVLDGTLRVRLVGDFVPAVGDRFRVVTQPVGRFAAYDFPTLPPGLGFVPEYTPAALSLLVTNGPPADPPVLLAAGTLNGTQLSLCFSEPLTPASATNVAHYRLNDGPPGTGIASATLHPNGRSVVLHLTTPVAGPFTVQATGVTDFDLPPRTGGGTASGTRLDWLATDIGTPGDPAIPGTAAICGNDTLELTGSGSSAGLAADHLFFVGREIAGDFDLSARVDFQSFRAFSFAGLVARESLEPGSRSFFVGLFPDAGSNAFRGLGRMEPGTTVIDWQTVSPPTPAEGYHWVRLRREDGLFEGWVSRDGRDWLRFAAQTVSWADTLHVGLLLTAQDNTFTAEARFSGITLVTTPAAPPALAAALSIDGTRLTFSWPATSHSNWVLEATASLNAPGWTPVTAPVETLDGMNRVTLPFSAVTGSQFFVLRRP